jgi:hypothetical protein
VIRGRPHRPSSDAGRLGGDSINHRRYHIRGSMTVCTAVHLDPLHRRSYSSPPPYPPSITSRPVRQAEAIVVQLGFLLLLCGGRNPVREYMLRRKRRPPKSAEAWPLCRRPRPMGMKAPRWVRIENQVESSEARSSAAMSPRRRRYAGPLSGGTVHRLNSDPANSKPKCERASPLRCDD